MQFLKILAIAYATGGNTEVERYLQSIDDLMSKPSGNVEKMKTMAEELKNSLDVAGHALPMPLFASEQAQPAEIEMGAVVERMESQPTPPAPEPVPVEKVSLPEPKTESVPLPTESVPIPSESVPLPSLGSVPLPNQAEEIAQETGFKNEMEVDYAAQDAFAGAFGSQLVPEAQSAPESIESDHKAIPESHEEVEALTPEVVEEVPSDPIPLVEDAPEEEWVSDAERFIAAGGIGCCRKGINTRSRRTSPSSRYRWRRGGFFVRICILRGCPKNVLVTSTRCTSAKTDSISTTATCATTADTSTTEFPGCSSSTDGLAATNTTATSHAATTNHEHPTNHSFRDSLSRLWDWTRSKLAVLSCVWKYEHECTSLVIDCHELARFSQTRVIQPDCGFCENSRYMDSCM